MRIHEIVADALGLFLLGSLGFAALQWALRADALTALGP